MMRLNTRRTVPYQTLEVRGRIVSSVYRALGDWTPQKHLLVTRLIHRMRWWIKSLIWK
jgi:hypothetical protein